MIKNGYRRMKPRGLEEGNNSSDLIESHGATVSQTTLSLPNNKSLKKAAATKMDSTYSQKGK